MIDTKVTFNRVMSWINYVYDIHGELYWGTNAADKQYMTPGNSSWKNQWLAGGNGDGSLTYPGRSNEIGGFTFIPIASLRLKAIRDGLEDLEYMYMLEALSPAGRKDVLKLVKKVVKAAYSFDHKAKTMQQVRQALGQAIESLLE